MFRNWSARIKTLQRKFGVGHFPAEHVEALIAAWEQGTAGGIDDVDLVGAENVEISRPSVDLGNVDRPESPDITNPEQLFRHLGQGYDSRGVLASILRTAKILTPCMIAYHQGSRAG